MTSYLENVDHVYQLTFEDPSYNEEDEYALASAKLIDTNIIFGLLTEMLLEQPSVPNGPNLVYKYLAGSTVRRDHNGTIHVRNPNEISKNTNSLLRLFRHGLCSFYIRRSQIMAQQNESHKILRFGLTILFMRCRYVKVLVTSAEQFTLPER